MIQEIFNQLGIKDVNVGAYVGGAAFTPTGTEPVITSYNPTTGERLAEVQGASVEDYEKIMEISAKTFKKWKMLPAPQRGLIIRDMADILRQHKDALGSLVALENGKIKAEGDGEVQEMIDIADFAVGLSRQLYGLTMHSERPMHRMYEQWHPLGTVGIISAFNFPVAVWAWNAFLAAACGNISLWKPSHSTPLTAVAVQHLCNQVLKAHGWEGVFNLVIGDHHTVGDALIRDPRIPLVSFTGSTRVGKYVSAIVQERLGRNLLELGGNNAIIVDDNADLKLAVPAVVFGAVGTAGQRCTSTRRVMIHKNIYDTFRNSLLKAYGQIRIGDPLDTDTLMGPLINDKAIQDYERAIESAINSGGKVLCGNGVLDRSGHFVKPTIIEIRHDAEIVQEETFAPILYLIQIDSVEEGIEINNEVKQGLSSAIFTDSVKNSEKFLSHSGSDCGIANVNIGTSGAEIGGAFGGEKDTGGGRESGSDAWKIYMRRQTNTINWSDDLPLAQGISFDL
ncbi:MAG: aldehyde dehydrogenase family protein [Bacteroidetes bacterium]|nr:aldehyde dehydrogenase family protein [Bacteroidota bacterium]